MQVPTQQFLPFFFFLFFSLSFFFFTLFLTYYIKVRFEHNAAAKHRGCGSCRAGTVRSGPPPRPL